MFMTNSTALDNIFGESLLDDFFNRVTSPVRNNTRYNYSFPTIPDMMRTDVKESDTGYELNIDLPGYKKEDVKAELKDGYLTISAEAQNEKEEKEDETGKYIRRERYYGSCSRSFYVGEDMLQEDIKAKFEDGILKISVPKKETKPVIEEKKYIQIEG